MALDGIDMHGIEVLLQGLLKLCNNTHCTGEAFLFFFFFSLTHRVSVVCFIILMFCINLFFFNLIGFYLQFLTCFFCHFGQRFSEDFTYEQFFLIRRFSLGFFGAIIQKRGEIQCCPDKFCFGIQPTHWIGEEGGQAWARREDYLANIVLLINTLQ